METEKFTHSLSQPEGMDRTPPGTPKKSGKMLAVKVQMLDDSVTMFQVQAKALGRVLFDQVCCQLHLLESDYFGLEYQEVGGPKYWLDLEKPLSRQIGLSLIDTLIKFCVKFYTPDPSQLEEEFTRYLFCLQIKRDLAQGLLQCNNNTAALMASYIVQAECGDYVVEDYPDHRYLSSYKFVPNQDQELERRIMENHKKHAGQSPAEADLNLLETARRCELYGIKMHAAKDHEGVPLNLAVAHMGIVVFQNFTKINTFSWAKIRKISFKRKRFLVKLHPEGYGYYKDTVEFFFEGRNECKNFWKKCVENHGFFRCSVVKKFPRQKTRVLSRGSSFRYSGRTQKQIVDFVRENYVKRQTFQRSQSFRHSSSAHSSVANVGTSISAHPLLPLGENAAAGTPVSLSCGSMTLTSSPLHTADIHGEGSPSPPLTTSASLGTSITSSPQHFYPQESPFHRPDHHRAKAKVPHVHSHHGISPHQSPTDAATAVTNHSASLSNNNNTIFNDNCNNINNNSNYSNAINYAKIMSKDAKTSNVTAESPRLANVNDIYSSCYSSLKNLKSVFHDTEPNHNEPAETDIRFLNEPLPVNQGLEPQTVQTNIRSSTHNFATMDTDIYGWDRSASSKDVYHKENLIPGTIERDKNLKITPKKKYNEGIPFEIDCDSRALRQHDYSKRKSYSAISSQTPFGDQNVDLKIYSSSYPGTSSSLSTESVEGEPDVQIVADMIDVKYDSQEEMVLSHDDVSHDSYELLEKELDYYDNEPVRGKRKTAISESDRARSCSWGSDGSVLSSYDTGSTDIFNSELQKSREKEFWSLSREKNTKPKSETDFRALEWKKDAFYSKGLESSMDQDNLSAKRTFNVSSKNLRDRDSYNYNPEPGWEFRKKDKNNFKVMDSSSKRNEAKTPPAFEDEKAYFKIQEGKSWVPKDDKDFERISGGVKSKPRYEMRRINKGENEFEGFAKEKQGRFEDKRKPERKRIRKYEEETFHEQIQEEERREWEKEKRLMEKNNAEETFRYEDNSKKSFKTNANIYSDFREIKFKKFDRVVSNQFGKYSEFLSHENGYSVSSKDQKRPENQDKKGKAGNLIREPDRREAVMGYDDSDMFEKENIYEVVDQDFGDDLLASSKSFWLSDQEKRSDRISPAPNFIYSPKGSSKFTKTLLERTQSDSYGSDKNTRRSQLLHQKSFIDLTPQRSREESSDYDNDDYLKKTSRSEHDIPYVLHKRQCMNGTARNIDFAALSDDFSFSDLETNTVDSRKKPVGSSLSFSRTSEIEIQKAKSREDSRKPKKYLDLEKRGVQIINLDETNEKVSAKVLDSRKNNVNLRSEPLVEKKFSGPENKMELKGDKIKDISRLTETVTGPDLMGAPKSNVDMKKLESIEPLYAKVCKKKAFEKTDIKGDVMPENLKGSGSAKNLADEQKFDVSTAQNLPSPDWDNKALPEPPKRTTSQKPCAPPEGKDSIKENLASELKEGKSRSDEKNQPSIVRGKQGSVLHRRGESLILYARTRLGLSEGSAFIPFVREGQAALPPRRTKSLDAPYVSVHRLPPADSFSSKDDTVDGNDEVIPDMIRSERAEEAIKMDDKSFTLELSANTESDVDSVFSKDIEEEVNFRKTVKNQSKLEMSNAEKKILNGIRNKRLLSKIESVDMLDSEGDLDSSKLADPSPIPLDRMVNLPESVRFPSVRQISGQTSEESADGWEPKEVKLKRRTPRRSVGREEYDTAVQESVVWDSKDDESINDEVWDDNLLGTEKFDGSGVPVPVEYLKRGSCGQSIDDDNLSTPMKESSPEHWVSVEDLPEALEREEKLLKRQEKLLREKILNEKLKRELNLDSIDLEYSYKDSLGRACDANMIPQTKFKGHSLDTYELTEKKLRELGNTKNSSLDEHILNNKFRKSCFDGRMQRSSETFEFTRMDTSSSDKDIGYLQCTVVNDLTEIDQFEGSGEELEEFFVVLDENLGSDKEISNSIWNQSGSFNRSASKEESVISVPEEFKDVDEELCSKMSDDQIPGLGIDSPESKTAEEKSRRKAEMEKGHFSEGQSFKCSKPENVPFEKTKEERENLFYAKIEDLNDYSTKFVPESLGPVLSAECLKDPDDHFEPPAIADDVGTLSPYESLSRRSSDCPQRRSTSEEPDRLSPFPFYDSRRGSDDPRRLSTSEDSRKYSMSESVSEETRRRLSSTEETRRKRASLTKQCSVGEESLSDEVILGIQECSSSFEQEEKDVFETEASAVENQKTTESTIVKIHTVEDLTDSSNAVKINENKEQQFELEVVDAMSSERDSSRSENETKEIDKTHLVPPTNERELSRETEDSVDYCEDFKDIHDALKEKDISEGLICENDIALVKAQNSRSPSSFEKTESSDVDELRYIDEKRGSTPEIIVGRSKESVSVSVVVVNEGLAVLDKMGRKDKDLQAEKEKALSLPRDRVIGVETSYYENTRHTLPKISKEGTGSTQKAAKRTYLISSSNNSENILKSSLESSQESDMDKLCEVSVISQIHSQIVKRNLSDVGKRLRHSESEKLAEETLLSRSKTLEDLGKSESGSSATDLKAVDDTDSRRHRREDSKFAFKLNFDKEKARRDVMGKEKKSPDQEKRDSGEDGSSSSSAPPYPKRELSSTWKPFALESSGSSSLEEGWLPPDDNAHFADEEETSSTSNNQQDDSCHDDVDYPTGIGYPVMNTSSAEMMVGGYNTVFGLSRTLSRISERSTSEHERSDFEDDFTKPSSHSVSAEEESILSSDRQISLSSDPPSPKSNSSKIPELPDDRPLPPLPCSEPEVKSTVSEPFGDFIPPPLQEDDWPSPPSSSSILDTPVASHVETVYLEIYPEEAAKVTVPEPHNDGNSSSDENQTLQEEGEYFHLSSENISLSTTTTTTLEGTVVMPSRIKSARTGSLSEDLTLTSTSEWSSPTTLKSRKASEDFSTFDDSNSQISKSAAKIKPLKLRSPTSKVFGFFETPVSKVRSPTSQNSFFESGDNFNKSSKSHSESSSPKNHKKLFESPGKGKCYKKDSKSHSRRGASSYYSNAADIAEKSYFGRYDTGSLERTKIHSSRKCCSYYSVAKTVPDERNSSNSEDIPAPTSNTIPRASKKTKRRHKVALNLEIRDGRIVTVPKTRSYVLENSDSDRSSPKKEPRKN